MAYFKDYPYVTENIDLSYDPFVAKLKEVITITDQLFATQIHQSYGLYSEEALAWLQNNPSYKPDPYTVTRIEDGMVKETPYHIYYHAAVKRISMYLDDAIETLDQIKDSSFNKVWWKDYLKVLKQAYQHDTWDEAEKFFLQTPIDSPLLLSIGPIDSYHDKVKGVKRYFSAWLLIKNIAAQEQSNTLTTHLKSITNNKVENTNVTFYIGDLLFAGGEVAKHKTMGWSRSESLALTAKYGAIKMIAFNKLPYHTKRMTQAMQKSLQTWDIPDELGNAVMTFHETESIIPLLLHEYAHTYEKSKNAHKNLGEFYTDIEETRANTYMVHFANILETNGHLPNHTMRNIFFRVLLYLPYLHEEYTVYNQRGSYYFAALYWLQKAEAIGIVTIDKTITVNDEHIEDRIKTLISTAKSYLFTVSDKHVFKEELDHLKNNTLLFGSDLAIKLGW